jgi:hypothetical protein
MLLLLLLGLSAAAAATAAAAAAADAPFFSPLNAFFPLFFLATAAAATAPMCLLFSPSQTLPLSVICYHPQKQERERPAAECDESGGVFGLAHIKKKIEEAVAEANACDELQRKLKVP